MFRSLRFRLPALFLLGIVLAGLVATLIAVHFFQSYTRTHAASELRAESAGIVQIYHSHAGGPGHVALKNLERALGGDRVFWVPAVRGASLLAGPIPKLPPSVLPRAQPVGGKLPAFDLHVAGTGYLGVRRVVQLAGVPVGELVVAEPESQLRSRWLQLAWDADFRSLTPASAWP